MRPIRFSCREVLPALPGQICEEIARVESWSAFTGYGPLPGIAHARYEVRTEEMRGSRIRVQNRDGSQHVEEVVQWIPGERVALQLHEFSRPLSVLADRFMEVWELEPVPEGTRVHRSFALYPRSASSRIPLWLISLLLCRAAANHLRQLKSKLAPYAA